MIIKPTRLTTKVKPLMPKKAIPSCHSLPEPSKTYLRLVKKAKITARIKAKNALIL